eukprot:194335-Pleurochrysis_carterae.AAC.1
MDLLPSASSCPAASFHQLVKRNHTRSGAYIRHFQLILTVEVEISSPAFHRPLPAASSLMQQVPNRPARRSLVKLNRNGGWRADRENWMKTN